MELLADLAGRWINYFFPVFIQNTIFLLIVLLLLAHTGSLPARYRYIIALAGCIKLLLPPFLTLSSLQLGDISGSISQLTVPVITSVIVPGAASSSPSLSLGIILFFCWLGAAGILLILPVIYTAVLKFKLRKAVPLPDCGLMPQGISLYQSDRISIPLTLGPFPHRIYLPPAWDYWSDDCRRHVLRHELAHIKRHDGLGRLLQFLVCSLYFFHPLVWLLNHLINRLREMACDDLSLDPSQSSPPLRYSQILLELAETVKLGKWHFDSRSCFLGKKRELIGRITYQMEGNKMNSRGKGIAILILLLPLFILLSWNCNSDQISQSTSVTPVAQDVSFETFDEIPVPVGGWEDLTNNLHYPEIAKKAGIEGEVIVELKIDEKGQIISAEVVKGLQACDEAALEAVRKTRWIPAKKKGKPIGVTMKIPVGFHLTDNKMEKTGGKATISQKETNPEKAESEDVPSFTPFDQRPEPVGGWVALQNNVVYPKTAVEKGLEGEVFVNAHLGKDGKVLGAVIAKGVDELNDAALAAVKKTGWKPALYQDQPVEVWVMVRVIFTVSE